MRTAPRLGRPRDGRDRPGRAYLVLGCLALAAVVLTGLWLSRGFGANVAGPSPQPTATVPTADAPIVLTGNGSQTSRPFHLAGATYRSDWSAWGPAPEFPPCTHSAQLVAVDPATAEPSLGRAIELATRVQVPATGASQASILYNLKPGDYYLYVYSECGWQFAFSPT